MKSILQHHEKFYLLLGNLEMILPLEGSVYFSYCSIHLKIELNVGKCLHPENDM